MTSQIFWRRSPIAALFVVMVAFVLLYWQSWRSLFELWLESSNYQHSVLIIIIAAYLAWEKRDELRRCHASTNLFGLTFLFALSLLWFVAFLVDVERIQHIALIAMVPMVVWGLFGTRVLVTLTFPLAYLWFAAPIWELIAPALQVGTAHVIYYLMRLMDVPVLLEGVHITIPSGQFVIEKVCGGLRYLLVSMALAVLYAYENYRYLWPRLLFVGAVTVAAIVLNWLRVFIVVWVGHVTEMQHPMINDHETFGWLLYAGFLVLFFWFGKNIIKPVVVAPHSTFTKSEEHAGSVLKPKNLLVGALLTVGVLVVAPVTAMALKSVVIHVPDEFSMEAPSSIGSWQGGEPFDGAWQPLYRGATGAFNATYQRSGSGNIQLYTAYYQQQDQGAELINSLNYLYDEEVWRDVLEKGSQKIEFADTPAWQIKETVVRSVGGEVMLIWSWYRVAGYVTPQPIVAKLLGVWGLFTQTPGASVFAIATLVDEANLGPSRNLLKRFLQEARPSLDRLPNIAQPETSGHGRIEGIDHS
ncbi:MAG: EpsI family protein [Gammaproteobacteria bacterium]|nr:EpsI family protein [Gammaproteobacteria bacterium]